MSELILRAWADRGDKNGARFHDFRALQEPRSQLCSRHKFLVKKNQQLAELGIWTMLPVVSWQASSI